MGVLMLGVITVPGLYSEKRFDMASARSLGSAAPPVMGMAFAFGWTPCVGPILASILAIAGTSSDVGRGTLLLLLYSAGLAVPFLLVGLLFGKARGTMRFLTRHSLTMNRIAGSLLIVMGVLMATGRLAAISGFILRYLPSNIG
jgi:cytochrome c-type biogenesis protein